MCGVRESALCVFLSICGIFVAGDRSRCDKKGRKKQDAQVDGGKGLVLAFAFLDVVFCFLFVDGTRTHTHTQTHHRGNRTTPQIQLLLLPQLLTAHL